MPFQKNTLPRQSTLRPAVAALAAASLCGAARAEDPSPWYLGASVGVTRDSNVFRIPDGSGDTYTTTSLLAGFDQPIGRQRLYGTARVGYNKYQNFENLDNTSYGVDAGWDWATIEKLSGKVYVGANQSLAQLNGNTSAPSTRRNIVKSEQFGTSATWGGFGPLSLFANYGHNRVRYSAVTFTTSNSTGDTGSLGTNYRLGGSTSIGVAVRVTRTRLPYGQAIDPLPSSLADFGPTTTNGRNLDLLGNWTYSPQTNVAARLSYTRQTDSFGGGRDFSGLTGSLSGNYAPTAKLAFNAMLQREAGANSVYNSPTYSGSTNAVGLNQNTTTTDSLSLGATYAATAKISVNSGLLYRSGKLSSDGSDDLTQLSLGATYAVARNWQLACNLTHETRKVSGLGSFSYDANTAGCSAQFTLR